jgi:uncharacterized membrane protein YqjE
MMDDPVRTAGGTLGEYAWREPGRERSMSDVLRDIFGNVQEMVRSELRLARAELKEEAGKTMSSAKLLGIGAGLGLFAGAFLLVTIALLLALVMPGWAATLIMAIDHGVPGLELLTKGRSQLTMQRADRTNENVKENVEWIKNQTR